MCGDPCIWWERPTVLPKTANSFSLPKAKLYRAAQLWNAMPQAKEPEINRILNTITAQSPRRTRVGVKNISDPVAGFCASLTDSAAPVPEMAIHEKNESSAPMPMTEIMVAWGIIFFGFRDYSPYMAEDSNPTQDQKAKNRPIPAVALGIPSAALNALTGLTDAQDSGSQLYVEMTQYTVDQQHERSKKYPIHPQPQQ